MEKHVGTITQYYAAGHVAEVKLIGTLHVNNHIHIMDKTTDFEQIVKFIYIGQNQVDKATAGETIWLGVLKRVHNGDKIFVKLEKSSHPKPPGPEPPGPEPPGPEPPGPEPPNPEPPGPEPPNPEPPGPEPPNPEPPGPEPPVNPDLPDWDDFRRRKKRSDDKGGGAGG